MDAGRHRRRVAVQNGIVRKILRDIGEINGNTRRRDQKQDAGHSEEISKKSNHISVTGLFDLQSAQTQRLQRSRQFARCAAYSMSATATSRFRASGCET
jgi:hypothetical protein